MKTDTLSFIILNADSPLLEKGTDYFWIVWGKESNRNFYLDCIRNSGTDIPVFFLCLSGKEICGSVALLRNDLVSRQDLQPWLACLYVEERYRRQGIAALLIDHALTYSRHRGYPEVYLTTDLVGFYERKGWIPIAEAYNPMGVAFPVYTKAT